MTTKQCALFPPELLACIRDRFCHVDSDEIMGQRIYFENAGGSLTLKSVVATSTRIDSLPDNAGRHHATSKHLGNLIVDGRAAVATFLNAQDGIIVAREGATAMLFALVDAVTSAVAGGNIVCSNLDHPATFDSTAYFCKKRGLERRVAALDTTTGTVPVASVLEHVDQETIALVMVHASNVTGGVNDMPGIITAVRAKAPQAAIILDGTQFVQHGNANLAELGVDAYVFASYKVFSKVGSGFAYVGPRLVTAPHPGLAGKPETEWDLGTRDAGNFAAFRDVVNYLEWLGGETGATNAANNRNRIVSAIEAIGAHEQALGVQLLDGLQRIPGTRVLGDPTASPNRQAVFALAHDGQPASKVVIELAKQGIVVHQRLRDAFCTNVLEAFDEEEVVRVSLAHYNTPDEVTQFLKAYAQIVQ